MEATKEKNYDRKTLFLYPKVDEKADNDAQIRVYRLIAKLKNIVNIANQELENILTSNSFSYIKCLPEVAMEELYNASENEIKGIDNVRICVIGYNGTSYENEYDEICHKYKSFATDISHLVGLIIDARSDNVQFSHSKDNKFDVVIHSGLSMLKSVLISIMLDISLYPT